MQARVALAFLIRAFIAFVVVVSIWRWSPVSVHYHRGVAALTRELVDASGAPGPRGKLAFEGADFVFHGGHAARPFRIRSPAGPLTSNLVLLVTLFIASPVRPLGRTYLGFLAASLLGLLVIHGVTLYIQILKVALHDPAVRHAHVHAAALAPLLAFYTKAYSYIGMYILVVAAWCPYILIHATRTSPTPRRRHATATRSRATGRTPRGTRS